MHNIPERHSNLGVFRGYASVFNYIDEQNDLIKPGAFQESLKRRKVALLWQHNAHEPVGKILNVYEDRLGLLVTGKLNLATRRAQEIYHMMKDGIITSLSIGYRVLRSKTISGVRVITKVDLWEISLVTFPSNRMAKISEIKAEYPRKH